METEGKLPSSFGKKKTVNKQNRRNELKEKVAGQKFIHVTSTNKSNSIIQTGPSIPKDFCPSKYPITQELYIKSPNSPKQLSSIVVNENGNRVYTGGYMSTIQYWDLNSINAFQTLESVNIQSELPSCINSIDIATNESIVLTTNNEAEISLYDNKGLKKGRTKRGDMYLYDTLNTSGHTGIVTSAYISPSNQKLFASSSQDGTLRFWDMDHLDKQLMLYKLGTKGGIRNPGYGLRWSIDGGGVFVVTGDSTVSFYSESGATPFALYKLPLSSPAASLDVASDGVHIVARSQSQNEISMWDIRQPLAPIFTQKTYSNSPTVSFSPDCKKILVGETVHTKSSYGGGVSIVSCDNGVIDDYISLPSGVGATCTQWNKNTNQIYIGCSDGSLRVMFDYHQSSKGAMLAICQPIAIRKETDEAIIGTLIPKLVNTDKERVISGFWFQFTDKETRDKRIHAEPKAPQFGEGHHGQLATHPLHILLKELGQVDTPDERDVISEMHAREKEASKKLFTGYKDNRPD